MNMILFRDVVFRYRPDGNFAIRVGRYDMEVDGIAGVWGSSGSGKTTLARLIAGLRKPQSGEIVLPERLKDVVYVPQFPERVFVGENVRKTAEIVLSRLGEFRASLEFLKDMLSRFGLNYNAIKGRYGFELSSGELRKFALSLGFACRPGLLILDEPSVGLDIKSRYKLLDILCELRGEDIIVVSHDRKFLESVATNIYFLESGNFVGKVKICCRSEVTSGAKDGKKKSRRKTSDY